MSRYHFRFDWNPVLRELPTGNSSAVTGAPGNCYTEALLPSQRSSQKYFTFATGSLTPPGNSLDGSANATRLFIAFVFEQKAS